MGITASMWVMCSDKILDEIRGDAVLCVPLWHTADILNGLTTDW